MITFSVSRFASFWRRHRVFFLAFFWCISSSAGFWIAFSTSDIVVSLMCAVVNCRVSIFGLVMMVFFPLLLSAAAVYFSVPDVLFPVIFVEGVSLGYCLAGMMLTFGSAGWLICFLLTFSESLMLIPQLWLWIQCFSCEKSAVFRSLKFCYLAAIAVCTVDYLYISPFILRLF